MSRCRDRQASSRLSAPRSEESMLRTPLMVCAAALICPLQIAAQGSPQATQILLAEAAAQPSATGTPAPTSGAKPAPAASTSNPLANPTPAPAKHVALKVERHILANGLRVVLNPD